LLSSGVINALPSKPLINNEPFLSSYTELSMYYYCEKKYQFAHVLDYVGQTNVHTDFGTMIHNAIEFIINGLKSQSFSEENFESVYNELCSEAKEKLKITDATSSEILAFNSPLQKTYISYSKLTNILTEYQIE
jgi:CRISPR/Cas system-associated exonuclease Cas4 (RecB family)